MGMSMVDDLPEPRPRRGWPAAAVIFLLMLLGLGGLFSPVLPSVVGMQVALVAAVVIGVLAGWMAMPGGALSAAQSQARWVQHPALRIPGFALFCGLIAYIGVAYGAIGLIAAVAGQPTTQTLTITGVASKTQWQCAHFEVREAPMLMDRALCAPQDVLNQAQAGQTLTVTGKAWPLGMLVENWQVG